MERMLGGGTGGSAASRFGTDSPLSFPWRGQLTAHPSLDLVAWTETVQGTSNLWMAHNNQGANFAPKPITSFKSRPDDEIAFTAFTAHGKLLFVTRPRAGANPMHRVSGVKHTATWLIPDVFRPVPRIVANYSMLGLARDGRSIYYAQPNPSGSGESLWEVSLDDTNPEPQRLFSVLQGTLGHLSWRADNDVLAFSNDRGAYAFIGIFARDTSVISWISPSVDFDTAPVWSAHGSLIWLRAHGGTVDFSPFDGGDRGNQGPDFSIVMCKLSRLSNEGWMCAPNITSVFEDRGRFGLASFGYGRRPLLVSGTAESKNKSIILFGSERLSGWLHVYAAIVDIENPHVARADVRELRSGACEDREWILGQDNTVHSGWLYVSHNCDGSLDSRGLERIRLSDGYRETIVRGIPSVVAGMSSSEGVATWAQPYGGIALTPNCLAWIQSGVKEPPSIYLLELNRQGYLNQTKRPRKISNDTVSAPLWNASYVRPPKIVKFSAPDGAFEIHCQLFLPPDEVRGNFTSGLIYTHGGSQRQFFPAFHFSPVYAQQYSINQWIAATRKTPVLSVNYRSGVGYGAGFRLCKKCLDKGAKEYEDIRAAAEYLLGRKQASPPFPARVNRVGIWGVSYGGLNALQAVARNSDLFSAAVAIAPIFNWVSQRRYKIDSGGPNYFSYALDAQPVFPQTYRTLGIGPLPHLATPSWPGQVASRIQLAYNSSPAAHLSGLRSPLLLVQGDADEEVDFFESLSCVRALRALNVKAEVLVVPDEGHGMVAYSNQELVVSEMLKFFDVHLLDDLML